jgi:hypothetical protein
LNERAPSLDSLDVLDTTALLARFDHPLARGPTPDEEVLPAPRSRPVQVRRLFGGSRRERGEVDVAGPEARRERVAEEETC